MKPCGGDYELDVLGFDARPRLALTDAALVAAVRDGGDQPTWLVTGTGDDSVDRAAGLLTEDTLRDRYAIAAGPSGDPVGVPAPDDLAVTEGGTSCG